MYYGKLWKFSLIYYVFLLKGKQDHHLNINIGEEEELGV